MPPLQNAGGQKNLIIFEVGYFTYTNKSGSLSEAGPLLIQTIGLYPMYVVPSSIRYDDTSRTPVTQTLGGFHPTRSGRGPLTVSFTGVFGVESRGLPPYGGTGEERFFRFWDEVVRFPDSVTSRVRSDIVGVFSTPGAIAAYAAFDPNKHVPYVNIFDLYNNRSFQCVIRAFSPQRAYRNGGATGNVAYAMRVDEAGPPVASKVVDTILTPLLDGMATWTAVNATLTNFQTPEILEATTGAPRALLQQLNTTIGLLNEAIPPATQAIGTAAYASNAIATRGGTTLLGLARQTGMEVRAILDALAPLMPDGPSLPGGGAIDWTGWSAATTSPELDMYDALDELWSVRDAARHQAVAGCFFGLSRSQYERAVTGSSSPGVGAGMTGSRRYGVQLSDTPESIERATGVSFDRLLALNGLYPDEALIPGVTLELPTSNTLSPVVIDGLPTFDSHAGTSAWGADFPLSLRAADGDLDFIRGSEVLVQGVEWLITDLDSRIVGQDAGGFPLGVERFAETNIRELVLSDVRFSSISRLDVAVDGPALGIELDVEAINGGYLSLGTGDTR